MAARDHLMVLKALHMRGHITLARKLAVKRILLAMHDHPLRDECVLLLEQCRQSKFYYGTARALERMLLNHDLAICHDIVDLLSAKTAATDGAPDRLDPDTVADVQRIINAGSGPLWSASDRGGGGAGGGRSSVTLEDIRSALDAGTYTSRQQCVADLDAFLQAARARSL